MLRHFVQLFLLLALAAASSSGQSTEGEIVGTAHDAQGAVIAGAKVTAINQATGLVRVQTTADNGSFRFAALPTGSYSLSTEKEGFSIAKMEHLEVQEKARQAALFGSPKPAAAPASDGAGKITIDDFVKVDLRVGQVVSAERVKGADKLLHMKVDIGEEQPRTIVAGIAEAYKPEALIGRKVAIVANLAPRKLRGIESQGMIVAASLEGGPASLVSFIEDVPIGARLK